jgi:hypothetical protein
VQFLVVTRGNIDTYEFVLTIAALPITIVLLFLAAWITRRETYFGQSVIITLYLIGMAYFIFKLVRMYQPAEAFKYLAARHSLTTFAVLTILLLLATISTAIMCMMNFGKGLKSHLRSGWKKGSRVENPDAPPPYGQTNGYNGAGQHQLGNMGGPGRMTIE